MRKLSHPIATFIVAVLVVIGVGVGVLAATMPLGHTTPHYRRLPPVSSFIAWVVRQLHRTQADWSHHRPGSEDHRSSQQPAASPSLTKRTTMTARVGAVVSARQNDAVRALSVCSTVPDCRGRVAICTTPITLQGNQSHALYHGNGESGHPGSRPQCRKGYPTCGGSADRLGPPRSRPNDLWAPVETPNQLTELPLVFATCIHPPRRGLQLPAAPVQEQAPVVVLGYGQPSYSKADVQATALFLFKLHPGTDWPSVH